MYPSGYCIYLGSHGTATFLSPCTVCNRLKMCTSNQPSSLRRQLLRDIPSWFLSTRWECVIITTPAINWYFFHLQVARDQNGQHNLTQNVVGTSCGQAATPLVFIRQSVCISWNPCRLCMVTVTRPTQILGITGVCSSGYPTI